MRNQGVHPQRRVRDVDTGDSIEKRLGRVEIVQEEQGRRLDGIGSNVESIRNSLNDLIGLEKSRPQVKSFEHYVRVIFTTLGVAAVTLSALHYYVQNVIESSVSTTRADVSLLKREVGELGSAIQWKPSLKEWASEK